MAPPSVVADEPHRVTHERWSMPLLVACVALAAHANSVGGEFVFDDLEMVVNNEQIRNLENIPRVMLSGLLHADTNYYRPVPPLMWMLLHAVFGLDARAYHVANIALHALSAVFVYLIAARLFPKGSAWAAAAGAVVFAVHPVNAESVAWISGSVDVCATLFSVIALWAYVREDARVSTRVISAVALLLALLSKESAIAVVPTMMTWDVVSGRAGIAAPRRSVAAWAPLIGVVAAYLALRVTSLGGLAPVAPVEPNVPWAAPVLLARYVELLAIPAHLSVLHDIRTEFAVLSIDGLRTVLSWTLLVVLAVLAARLSRRNVVWVVLILAPLLPALYAQAVSRPVGVTNRFAERHLYLSTVGIALAVAAAGEWARALSRGMRVGLACAALAVTTAFAAGTWLRGGVWRDNVTLWSDAVRKYPSLAEAHLNLGIALRARGDRDEGRAELREAVRLDRMVVVPHFASGSVALERGDIAKAVSHLSVVVEAAPHVAQGRFYFGMALDRAGRHADAAAEYREALRLAPDHDGARRALARLAVP